MPRRTATRTAVAHARRSVCRLHPSADTAARGRDAAVLSAVRPTMKRARGTMLLADALTDQTGLRALALERRGMRWATVPMAQLRRDAHTIRTRARRAHCGRRARHCRHLGCRRADEKRAARRRRAARSYHRHRGEDRPHRRRRLKPDELARMDQRLPRPGVVIGDVMCGQRADGGIFDTAPGHVTDDHFRHR